MTGTECCGGWIITRTHHTPSWHCCATCGNYVTIWGKVVAPADENSASLPKIRTRDEDQADPPR